MQTPSKEFKFDPVEHVYTLDGKRMYGVTTVLKVINKPALVPWSAKCVTDYIKTHCDLKRCELCENEDHDFYHVSESELEEAKLAHQKKKEDAGVKGTDVHAQIEDIINEAIKDSNGFITKEYKDSDSQVVKFVEWAIQKNVKFLASEQRLYSENLWCAGTADFICEIDGKLYIGDVKTSSGIYPEYFLQASAYARFAEEMGMYKGFHGVVIVNVKKTGGIEVKENYDIDGNWEAFKSAVVLMKQLESLSYNNESFRK